LAAGAGDDLVDWTVGWIENKRIKTSKRNERTLHLLPEAGEAAANLFVAAAGAALLVDAEGDEAANLLVAAGAACDVEANTNQSQSIQSVHSKHIPINNQTPLSQCKTACVSRT
jgi:hypothetical protein